MVRSIFDIWVSWMVHEIYEENNLDIKNWEKDKFFVFNELIKRYEKMIEKHLNDSNKENEINV